MDFPPSFLITNELTSSSSAPPDADTGPRRSGRARKVNPNYKQSFVGEEGEEDLDPDDEDDADEDANPDDDDDESDDYGSTKRKGKKAKFAKKKKFSRSYGDDAND